MTAAEWLEFHGHPGYGEGFAARVRARVQRTGETIAFAKAAEMDAYLAEQRRVAPFIPTSAQRNENRLTDEDRRQIRNALRNQLGHETEASRRVAARSIGCTLADLRDSEIDEIDEMIEFAAMVEDENRRIAGAERRAGMSVAEFIDSLPSEMFK